MCEFNRWRTDAPNFRSAAAEIESVQCKLVSRVPFDIQLGIFWDLSRSVLRVDRILTGQLDRQQHYSSSMGQ